MNSKWTILIFICGICIEGCAPENPVTPSMMPTTSQISINTPSPLPRATLSSSVTAITLTPTANAMTLLHQRPLALPQLTQGSTCVLSKGKQVSSLFGIALGPGPVYPVLMNEGKLDYTDTALVDGWRAQKVLWISHPQYQGPILVRGQQIDGQGEMRFSTDNQLLTELYFDNSTLANTEWRNWPSETYVRKSGCYAYQIDGLDFSYTVIFQAIHVS